MAFIMVVDAATAIVIGLLVGYEGYQTIQGAKDREKFQGGCGCCGAADSGLAKYFREKFEKELGGNNTNATTKSGDDKDECCGGCGDDDEDKLELDCCEVDNNNNEDDDCCGSGNGGCSSKTQQIKVKSNNAKNYGSLNNNDTDKNIAVAGCNKGCC
eukprot:CAMPEP_0201573310 /NCGR_PEP_ID=MMETSP0190_2-20130828/17078_1 /ASSEMBLY_ACC=CAM_ASM_000263 /TAXON_ID=37353 /ORGANISM="Rosalina sp." /LENGTH=156 /DNA_ID=CAMNT_0048000107 /DNA_START=659 /DNA_END=1130 /DNA_ORIENTATION=-